MAKKTSNCCVLTVDKNKKKLANKQSKYIKASKNQLQSLNGLTLCINQAQSILMSQGNYLENDLLQY